MMFAQRAAAALVLVALTLWLQCGGIALLINWVKRFVAGDIQKLCPFHTASLVVRLTTVMVALHVLEILLWAGCYRWFCFASWESAVYFSAASYSTVGYGDVTLLSTAAEMPATACADCHKANVAKTDMTWVQFYPLLREK